MTEGEGRLVAGRYRLGRALGQGGMGVVWLAYDEYLQRTVAVKEILPRGKEIRETDPEVRRALREARAAAKLSKHPGIITVHDVVTDDSGLPWIVMELLRGRSLRAALEADGPMRVEQAARIGVQVLAALDYAHGEGVLHRDVKPGNVMLAEDHQAVLTDFGIAVLDGVSVLTATGQIPGSPEYVAPERIRGGETLPAADLWSVGVMLYVMVVGRGPFQRADIQATMGAALTLHPDPDPRVGRLAPVVDGLLRKNPADRMTARQAIDLLTRIAAADQPVEATVPRPARVAPDTPTLDPASTFDPVPTRDPGPTFDPVLPLAPGRTLDPAPPRQPPVPRRPRPRRGPLVVAGAVLVVVAVVVAIVIANRPGDGSSAEPTTTTSLKPYQDPLGFEIDIPEGWARSSSLDGPVTDVTWEGPNTDPTVGALKVQVVRDTTVPGVSARTYLAEEDQTQRASQDKVGYHTVGLTDERSSANLEYTYQAPAGSPYFRVRVTAFAPDEVYTLTFSTSANDATALDDRWRAAVPLFDEIRDSFELTS